MKCENCGNPHDGSYGSGRFCSKHCRCSYIAKQVKNRHIPHRHKRANPGTWKCCHCGLVFDTKELMNEHKHNEHPHPKGQAWNKGLTKETSEAMRRRSATLNRRIALGEIKPSMLGKHLSSEHKKKISDSMKKPTQKAVRTTLANADGTTNHHGPRSGS